MSWPFKDLKQFVIKFIARFLSYQILTGYSLKIVFYIPEVSIVFIWVQRCLLLPCHLTTDLIREWGATLAQVKHSVSETQTFNWYLIFPQSDFKQEQKVLAISHDLRCLKMWVTIQTIDNLLHLHISIWLHLSLLHNVSLHLNWERMSELLFIKHSVKAIQRIQHEVIFSYSTKHFAFLFLRLMIQWFAGY